MSPEAFAPSIPGFEVMERIGGGGFGTVFRAFQPRLNRAVAIKVLHSAAGLNERALHRFEREQQAMGALSSHPGIVTLHETGFTADGLPYLVMELMEGGSLGDRLTARGPMPWAEAVDLTVQVAGAVEEAHKAGVLHRDIKPENILISRYGETKLTDFGIAALMEGTATATTSVTATVEHAAPEVLGGRTPTAAADTYSLASTLYALLAGHSPFRVSADESMLSILGRVATQTPPDLRAAGVPETVWLVLEQALAREPETRPRSAAAFAESLREASAAAANAGNATAATSLEFARQEPSSPAGRAETPVHRPPEAATRVIAPHEPTPHVRPLPPEEPRQAPTREPRLGKRWAGLPLWAWALIGLAALTIPLVLILTMAGGEDSTAVTVAEMATVGRAVLAGGGELNGAAPAEAGEAAPEAALEGAVAAGEAVLFEVTGTLEGPATVLLPFDATALPESAGSEPVVFGAYLDAAQGSWIRLPSEADWTTGMVSAVTTHLSWWQPWAWNLEEVGGALGGALASYVDGAASTSSPAPRCGATPTGVAVSVDREGQLAACAETDGSDGTRVKLTNRGAFGVMLDVPANASVEESTQGTMDPWLVDWLSRQASGGGTYLPPGAELSLLIDLTGQDEGTVPAQPSEPTLVADFLATVCEASAGICAALGEADSSADCLLTALEQGGPAYTFGDLANSAAACAEYLVPGAAALFGAGLADPAADGLDEPVSGWITSHAGDLAITYDRTAGLPAGTYFEAAQEVCVIGSEPDLRVNVRSGPSSDLDIVGTLAPDATGIDTTGAAVLDTDGEEWRQIDFGTDAGWVFSSYLTRSECALGQPRDYCVEQAVCEGDIANVRSGLSVDYEVIGTLAPNADDVQGTGATSTDEQGRSWVQIELAGDVGWVAGWLLRPEPCSPTVCALPAQGWVMTSSAVGPFFLNMLRDDMREASNLSWGLWSGSGYSCEWWQADGIAAELRSRTEGLAITSLWITESWLAHTSAGIRVGSTRADILDAYGGRVTEIEDGHGGATFVLDPPRSGSDQPRLLMVMGSNNRISYIVIARENSPQAGCP